MKVTIGLDSLVECIASGYMLMRYDDALPLDKQELRFIQTIPEDCRKGKILNSTRQTHMNLSDLRERYIERQEAYDSFAGIANNPELTIDWTNPLSVCSIAGTIQAYDGYIFE